MRTAPAALSVGSFWRHPTTACINCVHNTAYTLCKCLFFNRRVQCAVRRQQLHAHTGGTLCRQEPAWGAAPGARLSNRTHCCKQHQNCMQEVAALVMVFQFCGQQASGSLRAHHRLALTAPSSRLPTGQRSCKCPPRDALIESRFVCSALHSSFPHG